MARQAPAKGLDGVDRLQVRRESMVAKLLERLASVAAQPCSVGVHKEQHRRVVAEADLLLRRLCPGFVRVVGHAGGVAIRERLLYHQVDRPAVEDRAKVIAQALPLLEPLVADAPEVPFGRVGVEWEPAGRETKCDTEPVQEVERSGAC